MNAQTVAPPPLGPANALGWRRVRVVLGVCVGLSLLVYPGWNGPYLVLLFRLLFIGTIQLLLYGLFERWPARIPSWLARWVLQVVAVAVVVPFVAAFAYAMTTAGDPKPWYHDNERMTGYGMMCFFGMVFSPWIAMAALYRQISGEAQRQALAFDLERSEFERNALDARMRLLQAQVEPHFLFNTLANIRELVDAGSPQASAVLGNLIAYLRAAVPRLHEGATTLAQEIDLVRAYLEVMHMRMPDRLQFSVHADAQALPMVCPPMALLTLVENAVRHGIDPGEEGGRIDVRVRLRGGRCLAEVIDTGVGIRQSTEGLGTGLKNLRERLQLAFGGDAALCVAPLQPHGTCAEVDFPARPARP